MCDHVAGLDGQYCPAAGSYSFSGSFQIPGGANTEIWYQSYYVGWSTKIVAIFSHYSAESARCSVGIQAVESKAYQMIWSVAGVVVVVVGAVVFGVRRRRLVAQRQEDGIEFRKMEDSFRHGVLA
jgi:hypothetical protein